VKKLIDKEPGIWVRNGAVSGGLIEKEQKVLIWPKHKPGEPKVS
jgi:hypothetical protein